MSTGHTPGPWSIGSTYADDDGHPEIAISAEVNGIVCWPAVVCLQFPKAEGMQTANAHLIATAPEMLAVLQELAESASYWSDYDVPLGIADRINAAIAKATGSTQ